MKTIIFTFIILSLALLAFKNTWAEKTNTQSTNTDTTTATNTNIAPSSQSLVFYGLVSEDGDINSETPKLVVAPELSGAIAFIADIKPYLSTFSKSDFFAECEKIRKRNLLSPEQIVILNQIIDWAKQIQQPVIGFELE